MKSLNPSKPTVLILGASGLLGGLARQAYLPTHAVYGTSRSIETAPQTETIWTALDLTNIPAKIDWPRFDQIVVCSGFSNQARCESDPVRSRQINVDGIVEILERFATSDTNVVICSSDVVTDEIVDSSKGSGLAPSEYARQKRDLETYVRSRFSHHSILRLGKVLDQNRFIGVEWKRKISAGAPLNIKPELFFSPVLQSEARQVFEQTAARKLPGTTLVSANDEWSYQTLAKWLRGEDLEPYMQNPNYIRDRMTREVKLWPGGLTTGKTLEIFFKE